MIPEIGHFALILALGMAVVQAIVPMVGTINNKASYLALAKPTAQGQFVFLVIAYACLTYSFINDDFSVRYVTSTSNSHMPLLYKISGVWGAHEGSLLLWALILSVWTTAITVFSRNIPPAMLARVISIMGFVSIGFLLFLLLTSNPFERLFPIPADGRSLNPLLQDPGLAIHPPMLYMGYVGFSVAFSFAIAALISGKLDAAWVRWARPWTNIAWIFLTFGITLGSWWAYYELGWGGWWFWDPVENASLMPWIVGTALIHSLAVAEKRNAFKSWTVLLAIFAFSLSLLGTFLVRSGVLTSVHAFATDPERGVFILAFLIIVIGGSLFLYAWRAPLIKSTGKFNLVSRETALLSNNIILVVMAATVLLGTLYPLILDALGLGKISVGPPYFNSVIVPLGVLLSLAMGVGIFLRWKRDNLLRLKKTLATVFIFALISAIVLPLLFAPEFSLLASMGLFLASWVAFATLMWFLKQRRSPFKQPLGTWGMVLAHLGIAITITGVTLTSIYSAEKDLRLNPGQSYELGGYHFLFKGVKTVEVDNYTAYRGTVIASYNGKEVAIMHPEKRIYKVQTMPMTEAAIDEGIFRDLFVALGEPLEKGAWSVRIYHKPFVRWIWLGGIFMVIGGLLAAFDKRYRLMSKKKTKSKITSKKAIKI